MRPSASRQSLWAVAAQVLITLGAVVSSVVLNRTLRPEGRSDVALMMLWPTVLAHLLTAGWGPAIAARVSKQPASGRGLWSAWSLAGLALALVTMAAGWFLIPPALAEQPGLWAGGRWFLLFILFFVFGSLACTVLEALGRFDLSTRVRVGHVACTLALLLPLAVFQALVPQSYLAVVLVTQGLVNGYALWLMSRVSCGSWRPRFLGTPSFALHAAPLTWSLIVQQRVDQVLIATLTTPESAAFGAYVAGTALGSLLTPVGSGLALVLLPESARRSERDAIELFGRMGRAFTVVTVLGALPLAAGAEWVLTLAYGPAFAGGVPALRVGLLNALLGGLFGMGISTLQGIGRPGLATLVGLAGCAASTAAAALLLPRMGYVGAAGGQALGSGVGLLLFCWALRGHGFTPGSLVPGVADLKLLWTVPSRLLARRPAGELEPGSVN